MSKKTVILIIFIILIAGMGTAAFMGRSYVSGKVISKLSNRLPETLSIDGKLASVFKHPFCYEEIVLASQGKTHVAAKQVCLESGIFSLMSDDPNFKISCESVVGTIEHSDIQTLSGERDGHDMSAHGSTKSLKAMSASVEIEDLRLTYVHEDAHLSWNGNASASLEKGVFQFISEAEPAFSIKKSPIAFTNSPKLQAFVQADLNQKDVRLRLTGTPEIAMAFAHGEQVFDVQVHALEALVQQGSMALAAHGIHMESPSFEGIARADVDKFNVQFKGLKPKYENIQTIRVESPFLSLDTEQLFKSELLGKNVIFSGFMDFWKQDAGAFLGDAPKKSVRKADIKNDKTTYKKNPISKKTLEEVRHVFDEVQAKIQALPAIDIQNGKVDIVHENAHFEFDAISFNTAELFKNSQKFQLDFNIRNAVASFLVAYDDKSPYPEITFNIKQLDASDFLRIINMPVPEKNEGDVSMNLKIAMSNDWLKLAGRIDFSDFAFYYEKISPNVVQDMDASAILEAEYDFKADGLRIDPIQLRSGGLEVKGWFGISNVRSNPVIEFELGGENIQCADIPKAIPKGFLPTITNLEIAGGAISPKITGKIPWKNPLVSSLKESGFEGSCYPVSVEPHHPENLNDPNYTFTTDYTYFTDAITVGPGTKDYTPLEEIPPYVKAAMFLTEDKRFFDHGPLRISFIERALRLNLNQRSYVYGGSTIGQQLTKNLFLNRSKNLARKLEEAFIAWRMVTVVPKTRIFELYLNVIEFGPDVYGIKKASKFYFDKQPSELTPLEGAYLASLKVSPSKGGRFYKQGFAQNGRWWHKRLRYILKVLAENGYISVPEVIAAYDWTPKFVYPSNSNDFRQI
ncbi:MAG: transglycosylase domain-containing protein, partial [Proteobacteria bacterium]|nr:transglycosylase domain-containing protein [Pseudomonadota bacterium]